jgi:hypothetical protein
MLKDVCGEYVASQVWHGRQSSSQSEKLIAASERGRWWQYMDHDVSYTLT